jgi:hypothetical protein
VDVDEWKDGVVREAWQRLLGWLVSAAAFFICSCRLSAVNLVVSHAWPQKQAQVEVNIRGDGT